MAKVKMINKVQEKGYRNNPLTETQISNNNKKSKIRVRVEHIFGFMHQIASGLFIRTIGKARAAIKIGLMNLTYNLFRSPGIWNLQGHSVPLHAKRHAKPLLMR